MIIWGWRGEGLCFYDIFFNCNMKGYDWFVYFLIVFYFFFVNRWVKWYNDVNVMVINKMLEVNNCGW